MRIAAEKEGIIDRIEDAIKSFPVHSPVGGGRLLSLAREFQNDIARLRAEESGVPRFLYRWFRDKHEGAVTSAAKNWRDRLLNDKE